MRLILLLGSSSFIFECFELVTYFEVILTKLVYNKFIINLSDPKLENFGFVIYVDLVALNMKLT